MQRTVIPGSAPDHTGYRREGAADPDARVEATIVLRPRDPDLGRALLSGAFDPSQRASSGADPKTMDAVQAFARAHDLKIETADPAARSISVSGTPEQMGRAFGVSLGQFVSKDGARRLSYEGQITLPPDIAAGVTAVLGLDTRPVAHPR
jgi:kumamolisin